MRVAEVSTAVVLANSLVRNRPETDIGATRSRDRPGRGAPVFPAFDPSDCSTQTTSTRSGMGGTNEVRIRVAVSLTSFSAVTASVRAEAAWGSLGVVSIAVRAALAASRNAVR